MPQNLSKNYCTFYIARHGETEWNVKKIILGHGDSPLTEKGEKQAKLLGEKIKHIRFDKVYSSDLLRAKRTAEIITLEQKLAVETTRLLRERKWGRFEGQPQDEFRKFDAIIDTLTDAQRYKHKVSPDVESDEEIVTRLITFLREVAVGNPGKKVLVVTHGGIMRAFLVHLGFAPMKYFRVKYIENTAVVKITSDGVDFFIKETFGIKKPEDIK